MFVYPVIAALRREEELTLAVESSVRTIFLMYGDLCGIESSLNT